MPFATDVAQDAGSIEWLDQTRVKGNSGFEVFVASNATELDAVESDWRALEGLSPASTVFQSFAHIRIWARHFLGEKRGSRLHVAVVRERGRPVLILPLAISGAPHLRIARIAGDPIAQYAEVLLDPAREVRPAFAAALSSVKRAGVDAIMFRHVRDDSPLLNIASDYLRPPAALTEAPFADLSTFGDFPTYLKSLSKKVRQGLRNRRNHLEKAGQFEFQILRGGSQAREAIAEAIDLKRKWLVQRGSMSSAFVDAATRGCLLDLAENAESCAVVMRLMVGGEAAAIRFGFEYGGTHFAYMSAYDSRFADLSPGKLLMEYCISGFRERGLERIDVLPPAGTHKKDWCRNAIRVADYALPLTTAGRLYAEVYQEKVRPALKRAFEHLPTPLRSLLAALLVSI
jgi:CelD/BcsL family acetyltransferase involved in cellulose biosynthesis